MKTSLLTEDKVIITAAITGGLHGKWANEAIPISPEEQAQDALDCYNAGASVLHRCVGARRSGSSCADGGARRSSRPSQSRISASRPDARAPLGAVTRNRTS